MYEITHTMTQTNVKILNVPTNAEYVHKTNEGVINGNLNPLTLLYVFPPPIHPNLTTCEYLKVENAVEGMRRIAHENTQNCYAGRMEEDSWRKISKYHSTNLQGK
jgi:hypothetical protein